MLEEAEVGLTKEVTNWLSSQEPESLTGARKRVWQEIESCPQHVRDALHAVISFNELLKRPEGVNVSHLINQLFLFNGGEGDNRLRIGVAFEIEKGGYKELTSKIKESIGIDTKSG